MYTNIWLWMKYLRRHILLSEIWFMQKVGRMYCACLACWFVFDAGPDCYSIFISAIDVLLCLFGLLFSC